MTESKRRGLSPRLVAAGTCSALLLAASAAYAGIGALTAEETIVACKAAGTGLLRGVDDASECRTNEEPLTWNTQGPPGLPGPPGAGGLNRLEYVTASPDSAPQQAVEAVCGADLHVVGGAVRNRQVPGTVRASHPSNGSGSGQAGSRGWYGVVVGGSGGFSVVAICAPAASAEFRSSGGQYGGGQYGG